MQESSTFNSSDHGWTPTVQPATAYLEAPQSRTAACGRAWRRGRIRRGTAARHCGSGGALQSRGIAAREGLDVGGGQRVAAYSPIAAFDLLDYAPGDIAHVLTLDRDHCVGQLGDHLALLFLAEHVFDDANLDERH